MARCSLSWSCHHKTHPFRRIHQHIHKFCCLTTSSFGHHNVPPLQFHRAIHRLVAQIIGPVSFSVGLSVRIKLKQKNYDQFIDVDDRDWFDVKAISQMFRLFIFQLVRVWDSCNKCQLLCFCISLLWANSLEGEWESCVWSKSMMCSLYKFYDTDLPMHLTFDTAPSALHVEDSEFKWA